MISLKKKRNGKDNPNKKFRSSAYLRITKDIQDLNLPNTCKLDFPDPNDLSHFKVAILPDEGFYEGIKVIFDFNVCDTYPYEPPKVKCLTEIYHPNIDLDGHVCLNILREDWKPVLSINSVIYGLQFLMLEPNPSDPLNETAAKELQRDRYRFEMTVRNVARGLISAKSASMKSRMISDD